MQHRKYAFLQRLYRVLPQVRPGRYITACRLCWLGLVDWSPKHQCLPENPANRSIRRTIVAVVCIVVACDFSGGNSIGVNERAIQAENQLACCLLIS